MERPKDHRSSISERAKNELRALDKPRPIRSLSPKMKFSHKSCYLVAKPAAYPPISVQSLDESIPNVDTSCQKYFNLSAKVISIKKTVLKLFLYHSERDCASIFLFYRSAQHIVHIENQTH